MHRQLCNFFSLFFLTQGFALSQSSGHTVSVSVPTLLQLRLGDEVAQQFTLPITADIHEGVYELTPATSTLFVRSNTSWKLLASFTPFSETPLRLTGRLGLSWQRFKSYEAAFAAGPKTLGWQPLEIAYGIETPLPPDGTYRGIITYTLVHP
jgi:hypothetical protein